MVTSSIHSAVSVTSSLLTLAQAVNPRISAGFQYHQACLKRFLRNPKGFVVNADLVRSMAKTGNLRLKDAESVIAGACASNAGHVLMHIEGILQIVTSEPFSESYLSKMTPGQQAKICVMVNQIRLSRQSLANFIWEKTPLMHR